MTIKQVPIEKLIEDMDFYPRNEVSSQVVAALVDALHVGEELPPLVVDGKSWRIVDGWHRFRAYRRVKAKTIPCVVRIFPSMAAMFLEAVKLNATHGRRLDAYDVRRAIMRLAELGVEKQAVANAIRIPISRLDEVSKQGTTGPNGAVALKAGLMHLADRKLTRRQVDAVERSSGMQAVYHVNQLILLLENNIAPATETFHEAMEKLMELWKTTAAKK